ncbi:MULTISPECIES: aspartate:alanine exchanger family transporter [Cupriavidus]|uniref:YidE/YbjL duplication n=1 Tax=Cupriavidus pinatubonensis (strain JMP 134 / LMG 1197) TaxID=264198 RepID=Q46TN9_CUPPJ|nr:MULTISPECIES: TrkA C-terminal domain-containing protein [Cupriavidus]QYY28767.1 YidE/YbjL duplication [Cupriavidus pinatubonensis]TPQ35814.1 YidE/YbjL duplication [Cupriavidus pinatubonensis]
MDAVRVLFETQPLFTLLLTIALGYVVGEINIKGVALGSGAVLFVGLAIGGFAPKAAPPALVGTLGLLLFLYGIGIQYGAQFFEGLTSVRGLKANAAAAVGVIGAGMASLALVPLFGLRLDESLGIFAGTGTSTATLQAVIAAMKGDGAAVGYSVAYPFGVAGPILLLYALSVLLKAKIEAPAAKILETGEISLRNPEIVGLTLAQLKARLPVGLAIAAVRREHHNQLPTEDLVLRQDDVLLATSTEPALLREAAGLLGELQPGRISSHREDLDYVRLFASSRAVVGLALRDIRFPDGITGSIVQVRRGDADMLPTPELILEVGDRVGVLVNRAHTKAMRKLFGDSIKGTAELSFISIGIGAALGLLAGMIPLPIPGAGKLTLGLAALLLVALYLGKIRRSGPLVWTMPLSANLVLRNLGLTIFLAQVGISSGPKFFSTIAITGASLLLYSVLIVLVLVLVTALACLWIFRMPFDVTAGVICGATGNPAILAFANRVAPTEQPDIGYAMIFPSMTVTKILFVEIVMVLAGG